MAGNVTSSAIVVGICLKEEDRMINRAMGKVDADFLTEGRPLIPAGNGELLCLASHDF